MGTIIYTGFELCLAKEDPEVEIHISINGIPVEAARIRCVDRSDKGHYWQRAWDWIMHRHLATRRMRRMIYQFEPPDNLVGYMPSFTLSAGRPFCFYALKVQGRISLPDTTDVS